MSDLVQPLIQQPLIQQSLVQPRWLVESNDRYVVVTWEGERAVLSSAVLNGGYVDASGIVNLKVEKNADHAISPQQTLLAFLSDSAWSNPASFIGMMTAASMNSLRHVSTEAEGGVFDLLVTCGLGNARRVGDKAEWSMRMNHHPDPGTINMILLSTLVLSQSAMAELLMLVTEAKCAAMQELGINSPVSGGIVTGTGTDSVAIVNGTTANAAQSTTVAYCGKHTEIGERVGRMAIDAVIDTARWELEQHD